MDKLIAPLVSASERGKAPDEALDIITASYPQLDDTQLQTADKIGTVCQRSLGRLNAES